MDLGEKLKLLRQERDLNQPELAQQLGIEQSYLSKLENGKSLPSADILQRLLNTFGISLESLLQDVDDNVVRQQLRAIPQIATHIAYRTAIDNKKRQLWLLGSMLCFALGIAGLITGWAITRFPDMEYEYLSTEIVPKGEAGEMFESIGDFVRYASSRLALDLMAADSISLTERHSRIQQEEERISYQLSNLRTPSVIRANNDRGSTFTATVQDSLELSALTAANISTGASRKYVMTNNQAIYKLQPRWFIILGGFLSTIGFLGFCLQNAFFQNRRQTSRT